jgi:hypothetical protein
MTSGTEDTWFTGTKSTVGWKGSGWTNQDFKDRADPSKYYFYVHMSLAAKRSNAVNDTVVKLVKSANPDLSIDKTPTVARAIEIQFRQHMYTHCKHLENIGGNTQLKVLENALKYLWQGNKKYKEVGDWHQYSTQRAVDFGIGNCGECANLAYRMLLEFRGSDNMPEKIPLDCPKTLPQTKIWVESVYSSVDHCFVLIHNKKEPLRTRGNGLFGLKKTKFIKNYRQYETDQNIIVCDPWAYHIGDAYPAPQATKVWEICLLKGPSELEVKQVGLMGSKTPKYSLPSYSSRIAKKRQDDHSPIKPPIPDYKSKKEAKKQFKKDGLI